MKKYSITEVVERILQPDIDAATEVDPAAPEFIKPDHPFKIGQKWFFRTVTYHLTGRIVDIKGNFLTLEDAAWIADSGRFTQAINEGALSEVEPVNVNPVVNTDSICDAFPWKHELPKEQK